MKVDSVFEFVGIFEKLLDELPKVRSLKGIAGMVKTGIRKPEFWKTILAVTEICNILTGGKNKACNLVRNVSAIGTCASMVSERIRSADLGAYRDWRDISIVANSMVPEVIETVSAGPIPPRVISYVVEHFKNGSMISVSGDAPERNVELVYTSIVSCRKHGTTYAVKCDDKVGRPIIVLRLDGHDFVFPIDTIIVGENELLSVSGTMYCERGTDCSDIKLLIVKCVIETFDTSKYAFYPSDDMVALRDNYARSPVDMSIHADGFNELLGCMKRVLETGRGRGYAFCGKPGTGKTMLIKQLAWALNDVPLVILPGAKILTAKYSFDELTTYIMQLLEIHSRAIFVIDDIDGCEIVDKNMAAMQMIAFMDRLKECADYTEAAYIIMVSVNDSSRITDTIIHRSGRIDELINVPMPGVDYIMKLQEKYAGIEFAERKLARKLHSFGLSCSDVRNACELAAIRNEMTAGGIVSAAKDIVSQRNI